MYEDRYKKHKKNILKDKKILKANRDIIKEFLKQQEYKLKRKEGLAEVDERSYKTLYSSIGRVRNLNIWFKNKDWKTLTKANIQKLIDDLEDGVIKNKDGKRFSDRSSFYQMMKGKLFKIAGVSNHAQEILEEYEVKGRSDDKKEVRFINEKTFRKVVNCAISTEQKCLLWLAFDIGENVGTLLELEKEDFQRSIDKETKEPEYLVILAKEKIKRSRTARSEITNYQESVQFLDIVLKNVKPTTKKVASNFIKKTNLSDLHGDKKLFKFGRKTAERFLKRAVKLANARCEPSGQKVTWKDLRSSMACDLLNKGWDGGEINARLGHKPSSRMIDKYVNYFALNKKKPQKKIYESNLKKLEEELEKSKELGKLQSRRSEKQTEELEELRVKLKKIEEFEKKAQKRSTKINMADFKKELKEMEENLGEKMKVALAKERKDHGDIFDE